MTFSLKTQDDPLSQSQSSWFEGHPWEPTGLRLERHQNDDDIDVSPEMLRAREDCGGCNELFRNENEMLSEFGVLSVWQIDYQVYQKKPVNYFFSLITSNRIKVPYIRLQIHYRSYNLTIWR